jgi:hypothetical protein
MEPGSSMGDPAARLGRGVKRPDGDQVDGQAFGNDKRRYRAAIARVDEINLVFIHYRAGGGFTQYPAFAILPSGRTFHLFSRIPKLGGAGAPACFRSVSSLPPSLVNPLKSDSSDARLDICMRVDKGSMLTMRTATSQ